MPIPKLSSTLPLTGFQSSAGSSFAATVSSAKLTLEPAGRLLLLPLDEFYNFERYAVCH